MSIWTSRVQTLDTRHLFLIFLSIWESYRRLISPTELDTAVKCKEGTLYTNEEGNMAAYC